MAKTANSEIIVENVKVDTVAKNPFVAPVEEKAKGQTGVVRFWSTYSDYKIALKGKNAGFKNHILLLEESDEAVKEIRKISSPYVKEVLDVPFAKEDDLAKFNKYLNDLVYNGERGMATRRGVIALQGIFGRSELLSITSVGRTTPEDFIMKALKTKSFKEGI